MESRAYFKNNLYYRNFTCYKLLLFLNNPIPWIPFIIHCSVCVLCTWREKLKMIKLLKSSYSCLRTDHWPHNSKENHLAFNASCPNIFAYSRFSVSSTRSIYKWKVWDQKWARWLWELSLADTSRFSFMSHPQLLQEVRSWNIKMKVAHFWNTWSQNKHYSWGNKAIFKI